MRAFHEILTVYTLNVDPDQTAPIGAVWSGSTMFASMLMLNRHFSDAVILLAF